MSKYGAIKTVSDGIKFDSKREATRYRTLMLLAKAGHITGLTMQVPFELAPAVKFSDEKRTKPALRFVADFVYSDVLTGTIVVEDSKGMQTPLFRAKRHLMKTVLGIEVKVV